MSQAERDMGRLRVKGLWPAWLVALLPLMLVLSWSVVGCDRDSATSGARTATGSGNRSTSGTQPYRIVTLAPALTQMLADMGYIDTVVGVGEHDSAAPPGARVVGTYFDVNFEALLSTNPTHVLTLASTSEPPAALRDLARTGRFRLVTYRYPTSILDVGRILYNENDPPAGSPEAEQAQTLSLGRLFNDPAAVALRQRMLLRMQALGTLTGEASEERRPAVLMVIGTSPLMASGPGTVHDQLLRYAGGYNAASDATVTNPTFDQEKLLAIDPQVILLLQPGQPPLSDFDSDPRLAGLRDLPIRAVRDRRIAVINDPLTLLPATSLPQITALMAKAIHPSLADQIDHVMERDLLPSAP